MSVETRTFVKTNVAENSNKLWEISIDSAGSVASRNGRVGSVGQSRVLGSGRALFDRKIREKLRKDYKEVDLVGAPARSGNVTGDHLMAAVEEEIGRGNPIITELVRDLARINRHQILQASGGKMDLDLTTGIISTPVGVVTASNITRARTLLGAIEPFVASADFDDPAFIVRLEEYLTLVPQKVEAKRGWNRTFLTDVTALEQQGGLLDQLEGSIEIVRQRMTDAASADPSRPSKIFEVEMGLSEDPALRKRIETLFREGRSERHASRKFRISRIFDISLGNMAQAYAEDGAKVGGEMRLWHGTRAHNLISILKSGLVIPKSNGSIHVTGRMFGNGIYFSDQSTKSLNYSSGYWQGAHSGDRCYMFLADVAMGRFCHPEKTGRNVVPDPGYDSVYARGGRDVVMNNEMIVYRTSQANLKQLVEFEI